MFRRISSFSIGLLLVSQVSWALDLACNHLDPIQKKFLSRHVNYSRLDQNLEKRTVDQYVKMLDPSKIYFTKADVEKIKASMKNIYKRSAAGDCKPINIGFDLLLSRMKESTELANQYLGADFKLDKTTKLILNADKRENAKNDQELKTFQKKYMQLQVANYIATGTKQEESLDKIKKNYDRAFKRMSDEDQSERLAIYLDAFARSLDPHSTYWSQDTYDDFRININLSLEGIGATLSNKDDFTVIEQLIPGGAAEKSGKLQPKDKITAVAQDEDKPFVNVMGQDLRDVVKLIRGKKGTKVRLSILRKTGDNTQKLEVTLVRDQIDLEDEAAQIFYMDRKVGDKTLKVALIDLPSFYADSRPGGRSSSADVRKLLREARQKNVDSVVLDLSRNGGGSLDDAVNISGLFFREGNVVKQSSRNPLQGEQVLADEDPLVHYAGPMVILTSRVSASASEIVAGVLKDYNRAVIVGGDHTYGKGTVQAVEDLPQGLGALKTTIGMFFTAGGSSTQHVGVNSDVVFPSAWSTDEFGEKTLDYSLPPRVLKPFLSAEAFVAEGQSAWKAVGKKEITQLKAQSEKRVAANPEFKKILDEIKKNSKHKDEVVISDILEGKNKDKDGDGEDDNADADSTKSFSDLKKERLQKYLKRADLNEAVSIAADLAVVEAGGDIKLTRKEVDKSASDNVSDPKKN